MSVLGIEWDAITHASADDSGVWVAAQGESIISTSCPHQGHKVLDGKVNGMSFSLTELPIS